MYRPVLIHIVCASYLWGISNEVGLLSLILDVVSLGIVPVALNLIITAVNCGD